MLIFALIATIAIILFLIIKVKFHPAIAMFVGSLFMGIVGGLGWTQTIGAIASGFGSMMTGLAFSITFGVMLGQLLARTGAIKVIADGIIGLFGEKKSEYGLGLSGLIISIPVFYDVGFVVLAPLAKTLSKNHKQIAYYIGALSVGLGIAHSFIPPTPGPMTAAELVGINLGTMIAYGLGVGLITLIVTLKLYNVFFVSKSNFWKPETDEIEIPVNEAGENLEAIEGDVKKRPNLFKALLPIIVPIVLILLGTVTSALGIKGNVAIDFLSNKVIALFIGLLITILIALDAGLPNSVIQGEIVKSVETLGMILLITGVGGSLATVLTKTGVGDILVSYVKDAHINPIIFAWLIAWLIKLAQGSTTVGMVTALGLIAPMISQFNVNPVLIALAAISGCLGACHINDSGFWISANLGGLTTKGGLKAYTLPLAISSIVSLILVFILSIFVH